MKKFYSLDRIEDNSTAVFIDDAGRKYDTHIKNLSQKEVGGIYTESGGRFIYNEEETIKRRQRMEEKKKLLKEKANRKKDIAY